MNLKYEFQRHKRRVMRTKAQKLTPFLLVGSRRFAEGTSGDITRFSDAITCFDVAQIRFSLKFRKRKIK